MLAFSAALLALLSPQSQQEKEPFTLRALCAPNQFAREADVSAWNWLCEQYLPQRPEWPADLQVGAAFALTWSPTSLHISATALSTSSAAAGSITDRFGNELLWNCDAQGREEWFVPIAWSAPRGATALLAELRVLELAQPHTLDVGLLLGHLSPATAGEDPTAQAVALCGMWADELTFCAWRNQTHLRVCGRSGGGLLIPAVLAWLGLDDRGTAGAEAIAAFSLRHGQQAEAVRQLLTSPTATAEPTLHAMLHGDDALRLVAIDTLVRRGAAKGLPQIQAAAVGPLASLAARDAMQQLTTTASIDASIWPPLLGALVALLTGLWWRERCRLARARAELLDWSAVRSQR